MYVDFGPHVHDTLCVEHIWNRRGPESECWSNYATVAPAAHDWKHANSVWARIAIMDAKRMLAHFDGRHFVLKDLNKAAGQDVEEWVRRKMEEESLPDWVQNRGERFLKALKYQR